MLIELTEYTDGPRLYAGERQNRLRERLARVDPMASFGVKPASS